MANPLTTVTPPQALGVGVEFASQTAPFMSQALPGAFSSELENGDPIALLENFQKLRNGLSHSTSTSTSPAAITPPVRSFESRISLVSYYDRLTPRWLVWQAPESRSQEDRRVTMDTIRQLLDEIQTTLTLFPSEKTDLKRVFPSLQELITTLRQLLIQASKTPQNHGLFSSLIMLFKQIRSFSALYLPKEESVAASDSHFQVVPSDIKTPVATVSDPKSHSNQSAFAWQKIEFSFGDLDPDLDDAIDEFHGTPAQRAHVRHTLVTHDFDMKRMAPECHAITEFIKTQPNYEEAMAFIAYLNPRIDLVRYQYSVQQYLKDDKKGRDTNAIEENVRLVKNRERNKGAPLIEFSNMFHRLIRIDMLPTMIGLFMERFLDLFISISRKSPLNPLDVLTRFLDFMDEHYSGDNEKIVSALTEDKRLIESITAFINDPAYVR